MLTKEEINAQESDLLSLKIIEALGGAWEPSDFQPFTKQWLRLNGEVVAIREDNKPLRIESAHSYGADISAAWKLLTELPADVEKRVWQKPPHPGKSAASWRCSIYGQEYAEDADGSTAPKSICRAWLAYRYAATVPA